MCASAWRTFFALADAGTLMAYMDGVAGFDIKLASRECMGVRGGDISAPAAMMIESDWSVGFGRLGVARYTSLQAPSPIVFFFPLASVRKS